MCCWKKASGSPCASSIHNPAELLLPLGYFQLVSSRMTKLSRQRLLSKPVYLPVKDFVNFALLTPVVNIRRHCRCAARKLVMGFDRLYYRRRICGLLSLPTSAY